MTSILINGGNFTNKGAEAMLLTARAQLVKRLPGTQFTVWCPPPAEISQALESGFLVGTPWDYSGWRSVPAVRRVIDLSRGARWLLRHRRSTQLPSLMSSLERSSAAQKAYAESRLGHFDALVDLSGYAYGARFGRGPFHRIAPLMELCEKSGAPAFFLPQAWGPFESDESSKAVRAMLSSTRNHYYSRDSVSSRHLETALDLPEFAVPACPDIAFLFDRGTPSQGQHILRSMGVSGERPIVALAPNCRAYERSSGEASGNQYLQVLAALARHCIHRHGVDIVLQANEMREGNQRIDDRYLCGLLAVAIDRPGRCFTTPQVLRAEESRALLGCARYVVGSRYHSLVFALSQGIPCLGVSWSHKYGELLRDFGLGDYLLCVQDLNEDSLVDTFDRGWAARDALSSPVRDQAGSYRSILETLFDDVAVVIRRYARDQMERDG